MDRDLEALEMVPPTDWARFGLACVAASLTMVAAGLLIWTGPTEGYQAGYNAAVGKGLDWVDSQIAAAGGSALRACEMLRLQVGSTPDGYSDFIVGCSAGVDYLSGTHVPVIAGR